VPVSSAFTVISGALEKEKERGEDEHTLEKEGGKPECACFFLSSLFLALHGKKKEGK